MRAYSGFSFEFKIRKQYIQRIKSIDAAWVSHYEKYLFRNSNKYQSQIQMTADARRLNQIYIPSKCEYKLILKRCFL